MSRIDDTKEQLKEVVSLNNNFPFGMWLASVVLVVAGSVKCSENECENEGAKFAVLAGVFLTFFSTLYIYFVYNGMLSEAWDSIFAVGFFVFWAITAGYTTFEDPFAIPGNGFVAVWIGFVASVGNLVYNVKFADAMKERFMGQGLWLCLLFLSSIVVIIAGFSNGCCDGDDTLAIVAGSVSLVFVVLRMLAGAGLDRLIAIFLVVWWMSTGLILTFGAFEEVGNGFIATWVCIFSSLSLLLKAQKRASAQFSARFSAKYQNQDVNNNPNDAFY